MQKIQRTLMTWFWGSIVLAVVIIIVGESGLVTVPLAESGGNAEFILLTLMELLTIGVIPLALRLFKFRKVQMALRGEEKKNAFQTWAMRRLLLLCIPMLANTVLYYVFMHAAFGYLAIILMICLFFVYPSIARCETEIAAAQEKEEAESSTTEKDHSK